MAKSNFRAKLNSFFFGVFSYSTVRSATIKSTRVGKTKIDSSHYKSSAVNLLENLMQINLPYKLGNKPMFLSDKS
jgi:hypothetical protein